MTGDLSSAERATAALAKDLLQRLDWLGRLRLAAAAALAALTLLLRFALARRLPWGALLALAAAVTIYALLFAALRRRLAAPPATEPVARRAERLGTLEIAADTVVVLLGLHFTGGVENPFVVLTLLPPIVAAILLRPAAAYSVAGFMVVLLLALALGEARWPGVHRSPGWGLPCEHYRDAFNVGGEVAALAFTAFLSVYFVSSVAQRLLQREEQLLLTRDSLASRSEELARMNRELRSLDEEKSRFLSLAAHQLRGPLAATETCLAAVRDGYADDPAKHASLLRLAHERVEAMLEVVRDLLTLATAHSLARPSEQTVVLFDEAVARVVDQYLEYAASRRTSLVFSPGCPGGEILGDERALGEAVGNLVSNAIKYTPPGGHVKVITRRTGDTITCEVIDDGIGIPEKEKDRLFEEFFRASNARAHEKEGTGLGLAITREIVRRFGGSLRIESLEHLGTCVILCLPCAETPASPAG